MHEFLYDLRQRVMIVDGATGTNLSKLAKGTAVNILNLTHPLDVRLLHESFIRAGADVVETNTYGANSYRLSLEDEIRGKDINTRAVQIAREALKIARRKVYIAGAIGPVTYNKEEFETLKHSLPDIFDEQMSWLAEAGVDLFMIESFHNPGEIYIAVKAAKKYGLPIVAQFGKINESGSEDSVNLSIHAPKLVQCGADVIGVNCVTPHTAYESLREMVRYIDAPISVQPNAGLPRIEQGRIVWYGENPGAFATYSREFVKEGAGLVGGCCGTKPEHIAALVSLLKDSKPAPRTRATPSIDLSERNKTGLEKKLEEKKFLVGYEAKAPLNADETENSLKVVGMLREHVDFFVCPDHPLNKPTMNSVILGAKIRNSYPGSDVIIVKGVSRRDLSDNLGTVVDMGELDLENLCVVYGDSGSFNIKVQEVIGEAQKRLYVGTNFSPHGDMEFKLRLLEGRVNAGAKFALVQAIYSEDRIREVYEKLRERFGNSGLKIFLQIYPILSLRNAMYMKEKVVDVEIPDQIISAMVSLSRDGAKEYGIELARKHVTLARELADGIVLTQPIGDNPAVLADIVKRILFV